MELALKQVLDGIGGDDADMKTTTRIGRAFQTVARGVSQRDWGLDLFVILGIGALFLAIVSPGRAQNLAYLEQIRLLTCKMTGGVAADLRGDRIALKHTNSELRMTFSRIDAGKRYAMLELPDARVPVRVQMTAEGMTFFRATGTGEIEITTVFRKPNPVGRGMMAVLSVHGTQNRSGPSQRFGVCWEP